MFSEDGDKDVRKVVKLSQYCTDEVTYDYDWTGLDNEMDELARTKRGCGEEAAGEVGDGGVGEEADEEDGEVKSLEQEETRETVRMETRFCGWWGEGARNEVLLLAEGEEEEDKAFFLVSMFGGEKAKARELVLVVKGEAGVDGIFFLFSLEKLTRQDSSGGLEIKGN